MIDDAFGEMSITTDGVIDILDKLIATLKNMREGFEGIDGNGLVAFAGSIANGDIYKKYGNLDFNSVKDVGILLRYIRADVNGANALLKTTSLINNGLTPILNGKTLTQFVQGFINNDLPNFIGGLLQDDQFGVNGYIKDILGAIDLSGLSLKQIIEVLDYISCVLDKVIKEYDWIESILEFDENDQVNGVDVWKALERVGITKEGIKAMVCAAVSEVKSDIIDFIKAIKNDIKGEINQAREKMDAKLEVLKAKIEKTAGKIKQLISCVKDVMDCVENTIDWIKTLPETVKECCDELNDKLVDYVKSEVKKAIDKFLKDSDVSCFIDKIIDVCGEAKAIYGIIINTGKLEIIATPTVPGEEVSYLLSTNYDVLRAKLDNILTCLGMTTTFNLNFTNPENGPVSLDGNLLQANGPYSGTAKVSYNLNFAGKKCPIVINLAVAYVPLNTYMPLEVVPENIVQNHLSNIHLYYDEAILGNAEFVLLDTDGTVFNGQSFRKVAAGHSIITVNAPEAIGVYDVVAKINGKIVAKGTINVVEDVSDIWTPWVTQCEYGFVIINFADKIALKDNFTLTMNGQKIFGALFESTKVRTNIKYNSLRSGDTYTFVLSGVKYPDLFPSYSFTFTIVLPIA